ncbi:carboxymuconolactone decarboxylase family protein [Lacinutrix mariniflava]|uniref:carboxymuconolactone decarboxylase family protein n=1 Tax=Lacinutrix mariniflava TaxID=342955 RepID=UPI000A83858D|nr:carboxymuconolactone decarboxylase family protein [Lacinutrix mariniflava]
MTVKHTKKRFPIVSYEDADSRVKAIYDDSKKTFQLPYVMNWFKCQGNNAILLEGNWAKLKATLIQGNIPNVLKQLIIYNVSKERGCDYCSVAHGLFADNMSEIFSKNEGFKVTENLDSTLIPESYRIAIKVVTKAALHHSEITDLDFKSLEDAGFDDAEIQELMAQADLVNMLNTIADISGITIDKELME